MQLLLERRLTLPADNRSPMLARRAVRAALEGSALAPLTEDALLLTSELCDNAVLHAGTGFDLLLTATTTDLTVSVTDHGPTAMELNLAKPRPGTDRITNNGRGLILVDALASAWGTRHDAAGHHVWFTLQFDPSDSTVSQEPAAEDTLASQTRAPALNWPNVSTCRWLLHLPHDRMATMALPSLVRELARRLCEVLAADGAGVWVDFGDGDGDQRLALHGRLTDSASINLPLPLTPPLAGRLHVQLDLPTPTNLEIAELSAQRLALAIESDWIGGADRRRWSWMTYLAETSELLAHSLDVELAAAILPQIVVPRLGQWCGVHLLSEQGQLNLTALTHSDETELPHLRADLDTSQSSELRSQLRGVLLGGTGAAAVSAPSAGIAVPMTARGQVLGTVTVGRPAGRAHTPEEVMVISEVARRAAPAIDNAQRNAAHVETSQALQQALLPRALPDVDGVEFAAAYLPASVGADVGGDFYDVVPVSPGRWLVSIGDVCGKGARAAARTGQVREVLRVLVRQGHPPTRVLELLNDVMMEARDPHQFCTLALAMISRRDATDEGLTVELVLAGHDQPVLVRADGAATLVGRHGTAAGLVSTFAVYPTQHVLEPGDVLIAYTDGITECRRGRTEFGQPRLLRAVAQAAGGTPASVVSALRLAVEEFSTDARRDDIAMIAVGPPT